MSLHVPRLDTLAHPRSGSRGRARAFSPLRLIPATAVAILASLAGVLAIRAAAISGMSNTDRFSPLHPSSVITLTIIGVLLAAGVCRWLNRTAARPVDAFRSVALIALPLSFVPDAAIWITGAFPQTRAATVLPLIAMHILVAVVCLIALPALGGAHATSREEHSQIQ